MRFNNRNSKLLLTAGALIGIGILVSYAIFHRASPRPQAMDTKPAVKTINDVSAGLSFNMSGNFPAISKDVLAVFNNGALYGFEATNDKHAQCVITQAKTSNITAGELRDGVFKVIKNNHPNAHLDSSSIVQLGTVRGVLLQISFTDKDLNIKRAEVAGVGKSHITFAFCQSLASDSAKYYNDFTTFFSSLKVE